MFTSCSFPAISLTHESIDVFTSEGKGEKLYTNSIMTFGDVTLTRGVTDNKALHDWAFDFAEQGPTGQVKQVTIDACDQSGNPVMTWSLTDAFIKSYDPGQSPGRRISGAHGDDRARLQGGQANQIATRSLGREVVDANRSSIHASDGLR